MKNTYKEKIGVGIIGLGGVGEKLMRAFQQHANTNIVGICDTNVNRLSQFSQTYKDIHFYTNYKDLLENEEIDLVYIAVPPKFHYQLTIDALRRKKHVLCEKPLANSEGEAEEMVRVAEQHGVVHAMNFPTFYRNTFKSFYEIMNSNKLGSLNRVEVRAHFPKWPRDWQQNNWINSREQGGMIREIMPHYIHLIQFLFGPILDIHSHVTFPSEIDLSETGMMAKAQLKDGIPILFDALSGHAENEIIEFTIYGNKGSVSLKNWNQLYFGEKNRELIQIEVPASDHLLELVDNVVKCIEGKESSIISFTEGYEVQKVLEKLLNRKQN